MEGDLVSQWISRTDAIAIGIVSVRPGILLWVSHGRHITWMFRVAIGIGRRLVLVVAYMRARGTQVVAIVIVGESGRDVHWSGDRGVFVH